MGLLFGSNTNLGGLPVLRFLVFIFMILKKTALLSIITPETFSLIKLDFWKNVKMGKDIPILTQIFIPVSVRTDQVDVTDEKWGGNP